MSKCPEGLITRRELLGSVAALMATSPLVLWSGRARAMYNMGAFWKKKKASGAVSASSNLWGSTSLDPYWDYVTLLMQFDGTNGASAFADESNAGRAFSVYGSPAFDTASSATIDSNSSPYSGRTGSWLLNGTSDYVAFSSSTDYDIANGNFTIEFWAKPTTTSTFCAFAKVSGGYGPIAIYGAVSGNWTILLSSNGSSWDVASHIVIGACDTNKWQHIAVVRSGSSIYLFKNGVLGNTITYAGALSSAGDPWIGRANYGIAYYYQGNLADFRFYKGVAKYVAAFSGTATITSPSSIGLGSLKDPDWASCVLACPFENTLKDMSGRRFPVAGSASLSTSAKKFGTASASFGTSNYIYVPTPAELVLNADFTVEFWFKTSVTSRQALLGTTNLSSWTSDAWGMTVDSSGVKVRNNGDSAYILDSASSCTDNLWHHVAFARSGTTIYLYIDGTLKATATLSATLGNASYNFAIGAADSTGSQAFSGSVDSLRITKGVARYTTSFASPMAAFPVGKDESTDPFWINTVLAMRMEDLTDATGRHSFTNSNSVSTTTSTQKFGAASASFSGTSYLTSADNVDWNIGSTFTIEAWVYLANYSGNESNVIACWAYDAWNYNNWLFAINPAGKLAFSTDSNWRGTSSATVPLNTWTHVAISSLNGAAKLFINGMQDGTLTPTTAFPTAGVFAIGADSQGDEGNYTGKIDDLRITKGVARYLHGFTPPNAAIATGTKYSNSQVFSHTGADQTFTVPAGVTSIRVKLWGAGGGGGHNGGKGGAGGFTSATLAVTPGETLTIVCGGGGQSVTTGQTTSAYGGGGIGVTGNGAYMGGGGGRSAIRRSSTELLTAGGGGGAQNGALGGNAGVGGGASGAYGGDGSAAHGKGGTQSAGGAAGSGGGSTGTAGSAFAGGNGGVWGGGGGGGYYGGGGGGWINGGNSGNGGGGSGYIGGTGVTNAQTLSGASDVPPTADPDYASGIATGGPQSTGGGNGRVVIRW